MGPLFASETVAYVAPNCASQEGSGGGSTVWPSPFHPAHTAWDHPSLVSAWSLCAGHWVRKGQRKERQYGRVSVPLTCCHFPKFCLWVPEAGSLRLRFSKQFNEHLWEESHGLSDCRHPGTVQQFSVRSRACLVM